MESQGIEVTPEMVVALRTLYTPQSKKSHPKFIKGSLFYLDDLVIDENPEAHGVNVDEAMRSIGIELPWKYPPKHKIDNVTYRVSLAGYKI